MSSVTKVHSYIGNYSVRQTVPVRRAHIRPQHPMKAFHVFSKAIFSISTLFASNKIKFPTARSLSAERTINSKDELKQAIEKGNFEKVDQAARELKRSPQGQEGIFFLGKEIYEKMHRDF